MFYIPHDFPAGLPHSSGAPPKVTVPSCWKGVWPGLLGCALFPAGEKSLIEPCRNHCQSPRGAGPGAGCPSWGGCTGFGVLRCPGWTRGAGAAWGGWVTPGIGMHGMPWAHGMLGAWDCGCFGVPWARGARGACSAGGLCGPCDTWGVRGFGVRGVFGELRLEPSRVLLPACPKTRGARGRQVLLLLD